MARKRKVSDDSVVDANREQEVRDALKVAQADLQAAREKSQAPGFVPAESEESKAFEKAKQDVAEFEAAKAKAEAEAAKGAGEQPASPEFIPDRVQIPNDEDAQ